MGNIPKLARFVSQDGIRGSVEWPPDLQDGSQTPVRVHLEDGRQALVPANLFVLQEDGDYYLPVRLTQSDEENDSERFVVPVIEEELDIRKRLKTTGRVRVTKRVEEYEELVDEPGYTEEVEVVRVPKNQVLDQPAVIRQEGDITIIPLMEEVVVVETRLVLREELHVTKRRKEVHDPQRVTLRREEAYIDRIEGDQGEKGSVEE